MGTVLGIKKSVYDKAEAKFNSGFQLPPAGANILWVLDKFRMGSYQDKTTGDDMEYIAFDCKMTADDGQEYKHGQFFRTAETSDIQELKAFIIGIGRSDWDPENDDLEDLLGTKFKCDFIHYDSKSRATGNVEPKGRLVWKTLVPVNWVDGKPVDGADDGDSEEEAPARPRRRGPAPKQAEVAEEYDDVDDDDDGDDEEEEEPKGFKSFSPRRGSRRRHAAASDKD